jgi:MFS transporter, DHA2 family, multidrug resistance protein
MPPTERYVNPWIITISVMLATFMEVLDTTVVNVSLPHIAGNLSATIEESTWVLTSYLVANAIVLPLTGWLASRFGRKRLLMMSVTGFTVSSFICGLAPNLETLVFFRIVQGATGGAMQPMSQAVLLEAFPPQERGKAMGFWGLGIVVAPILGPVLGGWLTDSYSWRWVFYINIPVGALSLFMIRRFIFDPSYLRRDSGRVDYWGIGMLAVGIGALQLVLDLGRERDWFESNMIATASIVSAVALVVFIVYEWHAEHPVVDLQIFKIRTYSTGVFLMTSLGFVLYGSLVLLPIMLQTLLGFSSLQAGIAMAPRGMGSVIGMPVVGSLVAYLDPRKMVGCGLFLAAMTLLWLGQLNLNAGYWDVFWPQFFQGIGFSLVFVPLTTTTMAPIARERMGYATALFNLMRNVGGSVGIAVTGTLLFRGQQANTVLMGAQVHAYNPAAQSALARARDGFIASGSDPVTASRRAYAAVFGIVQRQATMVAFIQVFRLLAIIFLLLLPLLFLMKRPHRRGETAAAH